MGSPTKGIDDILLTLAKQNKPKWRHPMQDAWERRVHEFAKRSGALPPPEEGQIRLYRAGAVPKDSARSPEDMLTGPFNEKMTRREFHLRFGKEGSGPNPLEAEGRWFTDAANELDYYLQENDGSPVYYLDMPANTAKQYSVSNTPFLSSSRNPRREFVLPIENANSAIRILGGLTEK